jgi:hypothetical protein
VFEHAGKMGLQRKCVDRVDDTCFGVVIEIALVEWRRIERVEIAAAACRD